MYLSHFALEQMPFGLTPNTAFFIGLPAYQEAMEVLKVALAQGEGFIKVTGEVGTGKTLLCRKLMQDAPANWAIAYLPDPNLDPTQLRWALALELGLKHSTNIDQQQLAHLFQRQLIALAAQGKSVVVIIDEAQALPDDTLEALRLLSNLETEQRKLVQLVLFGQPELDRRLARYQFRQLRQRISFSYQLPALNLTQVKGYLQQRLQKAGGQHVLFSPLAAWLLGFSGRGIPRLINILAHKSLMLAYGKAAKRAGSYQVWCAALDTEDVRLWQQCRKPLLAASLTLLLLLLLLQAPPVWWPGVLW